MAKGIERLAALQVSRMKKVGYHADGGGLYLAVSSTDAKSWIFRYRRNGKEHEMGLGSLDTFTLAEARQRAIDARKLLADGLDPLTVKHERLLAARMADASVITSDKASKATESQSEAT